MSNVEIAIKLINVMDPSSVTDEAIKQAVLALLAEAEPKAEPKKAAAKPKTATKRKKIDWPKAEACRKAGWDYQQIADELGTSYNTVYLHFRNKEATK